MITRQSNYYICVCLCVFVCRGAWQATVHGVAKSQTRVSTDAHATKEAC